MVSIRKKVIYIPDIHGRDFWKKILNIKDLDNYEIVFTGDYLDPYKYEFNDYSLPPDKWLTDKQILENSIKNFEEIIEFAKTHKNVHMLLGNHDAHYIALTYDTCRVDFKNADKIAKLFIDNKDLFNIAFVYENLVFSHSGITKPWLEKYNLTGSVEQIVDKINNMFHSIDLVPSEFYRDTVVNCIDSALKDISRYRGGDAEYGSPFWGDLYELDNAAFPEYIQFLGHTQLEKTGTYKKINNCFACDSREVFVWDGKELKAYDGI